MIWCFLKVKNGPERNFVNLISLGGYSTNNSTIVKSKFVTSAIDGTIYVEDRFFNLIKNYEVVTIPVSKIAGSNNQYEIIDKIYVHDNPYNVAPISGAKKTWRKVKPNSGYWVEVDSKTLYKLKLML